MKAIVSILLFVFIVLACAAQPPQAFNYQAVAFDNSGNPLLNQNVGLKISILQQDMSLFPVYTESHFLQTNFSGVFNVQVGTGNVIFGNFEDINWGEAAFFIQLEIDVTGGTNYQLLGTSQLMSVPYALYAGSSAIADDGDWVQSAYDLYTTTIGNIGIGTTQPEWKVDVFGCIPDEGGSLRLSNSDGNHSLMFFSGRESHPFPFIAWKDGDPLRFLTDKNAETEWMRITPEGNVGIGTTSPAGILDIAGEYHFPDIDGANGQVLQTDGSGELSWVTYAGGGVNEIDDLTDAKTLGECVYLGEGAGEYDDESNNRNAGVGKDALKYNTEGEKNTAIGYRSLYKNNTGNENTATGYGALFSNTNGINNTAIGTWALHFNQTGNFNTAIGNSAGYFISTGGSNTIIGNYADNYNQEGSKNTIIGFMAGTKGALNSKSGNVFIGYKAGFNEVSDNKLYIENSNSNTPLIYGDFETDLTTVYGNLGVGTTSFGGGTRTLALSNGTGPFTPISNGVLLYAKNVSASSELKVMDEAGNKTTLSPHNFSLIKKSEPMAWSYYSENLAEKKMINVDMLRLVRLVEKVSGEKLAVIKNLDDHGEALVESYDEEGMIHLLQKQIDELKEITVKQQIKILELQSCIDKLTEN